MFIDSGDRGNGDMRRLDVSCKHMDVFVLFVCFSFFEKKKVCFVQLTDS